MKRFFALLLCLCLFSFAGCSNSVEDPGPPPSEIIHPDGEVQSAQNYDGSVLENAVTVRIGLGESKNWQVDMVDNAAANTMLGYLTASELRFPTYTYDDEAGYVAQRVRGSYTRDDEVTVPDPKCGELYLFSDGQLRFYYKDAPGANITATPVGAFADTNGLTEAVQQAYTDNLDDVWNVDVYFLITKNIA